MSQYYLLMTRTEMPTKTSIPVTEYLYGGNIPLKKQNIKNQAWLEAYVTADVKKTFPTICSQIRLREFWKTYCLHLLLYSTITYHISHTPTYKPVGFYTKQATLIMKLQFRQPPLVAKFDNPHPSHPHTHSTEQLTDRYRKVLGKILEKYRYFWGIYPAIPLQPPCNIPVRPL